MKVNVILAYLEHICFPVLKPLVVIVSLIKETSLYLTLHITLITQFYSHEIMILIKLCQRLRNNQLYNNRL
jgi:hypothetical protein